MKYSCFSASNSSSFLPHNDLKLYLLVRLITDGFKNSKHDQQQNPVMTDGSHAHDHHMQPFHAYWALPVGPGCFIGIIPDSSDYILVGYIFLYILTHRQIYWDSIAYRWRKHVGFQQTQVFHSSASELWTPLPLSVQIS